jgi:hypothetical protein
MAATRADTLAMRGRSPRRDRTTRTDGGATLTRLDAGGLVIEDVHFTDVAGLLANFGLA